MAIPAWKLQLQQNIAKKKSEKQKQEEQRRIQMLPPWKRAALEQQQTKNVIIISNTSSSIGSTKPTTTVSNSTSKTVITNSHTTTNNVNTVNSNSQPRTVSIVTANQRSPTHSTVTIKPKVDSGGTGKGTVQPANHVSLKQAGKSKSVDVIGGKKPSYVSSNSLDQGDNDSNGDISVSDDHCVSVHNNPFLRREKKMGGLARPNFGGQAGLGNRQEVQDSTSPNSTSRVAWKSKSNESSPEKSPEKSLEKSTTTTNTSTKNSIIITDKLKPPRTEPEESKGSERQSRSTERKLSVHDIMKQFGRAASHEEKQKVRRQGSLEEPLSPRDSPRSVSSRGRDYSTRERSPSPIKNRYRSGNSKPRPKSTPVEISTSAILLQGKRSPTTSPQPVRKATSGANRQAAPVSNTSNKVVINTSSKQPAPRIPAPAVTVTKNQETQKAPAPKIAISDSSKSSSEKPPVSVVTTGSPTSVILINKKHLADFDTHDAGRTPPPRRKTPLPASAIIDLGTTGPIQQASGKPPVDPEIIAKEKTVSIPRNTQNERSGKHIKSRNGTSGDDLEKPKPNTVSNLLGAFGQNKSKAPTPPTSTSVKEETPPFVNTSVAYSSDWRRPKSVKEKQQEEKQVLSSQANLKHTPKLVDSKQENNEKNARSQTAASQKLVELTPIPRSSSETISPIPSLENTSLIPNTKIISSDTKPVTQNGHVDSKADEPRGKGEASQEMIAKARALKKVKKKVNYEVIGGNAPTGKPSAQSSKSNRNRNRTQLKLTFRDEPEEYEYQSEASLLAEYGGEESDEAEDEDGRHSSVSEEDEEPTAPAPSGFRDNVPKGTGGLQSYTPSYLQNLTPAMMREQQEAMRRKEEAAKQPEPEPVSYDYGDDFSSAGSSSAAMLF